MRRVILGSIAALATGAGAAWGQAPMPVAPAGGPPPAVMAGDVIQAQATAPVIMPPGTAVGPPGDPYGLGPTASLGPPPGPMYPMPGAYGAPQFQPAPPGQDGGDGYGGVPRWWLGGGYGLWVAKAQPIQYPLLTTSSPNQSGLLGAPTTLALVGAGSIGYNAISGMQLNGGFWGDADRRFGAMLDGFYTANKTISHKFSMDPPPGGTSADIPLLARPFIDTTTGPSTLVLSGPNLGFARAVVSTSTQTWGAEANGIWNLFRSAPGSNCWTSTDLIVGYKFLQLKEDIAITTDTTLTAATMTPVFGVGPGGIPVQLGFSTTPTPVPVGGVTATAPAVVHVQDRFTTTNQFNGTVVGLRNEVRYGMFSLNTTAKIGLGEMHELLKITGMTSFADPMTGVSGSAYGGLYANNTNIGKITKDEFTVIPEITLNLGVNLTRSITATVGYNFMYINNVIRPGQQMSPVIDASAVPFSPSYGELNHVPGYRNVMVQGNYFLMGANFGFTVRY